MNVFIREMKALKLSLALWCIGVLLMVATGMGKYAGYAASGQSANDLMSQLPEAIKSLLGLGVFDLSKASGFYGVLFLYLAVMTTVHSAMLGANIISKEELGKTSEFLFVKPVSRARIITAKLFAALVNVLIVNAVTLLSSVGMLRTYGEGPSAVVDVLVLMAGMFILQLLFLFIGTGISSVNKNPRTSVSIAAGALLGAFVLHTAIDLDNRLVALKYLTPFKYFDARDLMFGGGLEPFFVVLSFLIVSVFLTLTYVFYEKKDLNV